MTLHFFFFQDLEEMFVPLDYGRCEVGGPIRGCPSASAGLRNEFKALRAITVEGAPRLSAFVMVVVMPRKEHFYRRSMVL